MSWRGVGCEGVIGVEDSIILDFFNYLIVVLMTEVVKNYLVRYFE